MGKRLSKRQKRQKSDEEFMELMLSNWNEESQLADILRLFLVVHHKGRLRVEETPQTISQKISGIELPENLTAFILRNKNRLRLETDTGNVAWVIASTELKLCEKYVNSTCKDENCHSLHVCKSYLLTGQCEKQNRDCKYSHDLISEEFDFRTVTHRHNFELLCRHNLPCYSLTELNILFQDEAAAAKHLHQVVLCDHLGRITENEFTTLLQQKYPHVSQSNFIERHQEYFKMMEDECGTKCVIATVNIKICGNILHHYAHSVADCDGLHMCKSMLFGSSCKDEYCDYNHDESRLSCHQFRKVLAENNLLDVKFNHLQRVLRNVWPEITAAYRLKQLDVGEKLLQKESSDGEDELFPVRPRSRGRSPIRNNEWKGRSSSRNSEERGRSSSRNSEQRERSTSRNNDWRGRSSSRNSAERERSTSRNSDWTGKSSISYTHSNAENRDANTNINPGRANSSQDETQCIKQLTHDMNFLGWNSITRTLVSACIYRAQFSLDFTEQKHNNCGPIICIDYLMGRCPFNGYCPHYHCDLPYQWQYYQPQMAQWIDFPDSENKHTEAKFCDPATTLYAFQWDSCPEMMTINFNEERIEIYPFANLHTPIRRLTTPSAAEAPPFKHFVTTWNWYWQNNNGRFVKYENKTTNQNSHTNIGSEEIEEVYVQNHESYAHWSSIKYNYTIDFKNMVQRNGTGKVKPIRRRPVHFVIFSLI